MKKLKTNEYKNYLLIQHNEDTYISLDNNHDKVLTDLLIELINSFDLKGNKSHSELLKILNNYIVLIILIIILIIEMIEYKNY